MPYLDRSDRSELVGPEDEVVGLDVDGGEDEVLEALCADHPEEGALAGATSQPRGVDQTQ